jgi:hypothetical protein
MLVSVPFHKMKVTCANVPTVLHSIQIIGAIFLTTDGILKV